MDEVVAFPGDDDWPTVDLDGEGWQRDRLNAALDLAEACGTNTLLILHRGRIVAERSWRVTPDRLGRERQARYQQSSLPPDRSGHPVADVGGVQSSVCATLLAIARDRGIIDFNHPVQEYLGPGWSAASLDQEREIAIWHLMSMTSGLDANLGYQAPAGRAWLYNPAAYQQLIRILTTSSGLDPDAVLRGWLGDRIGMSDTRWIPRDWSGSASFIGLASTARDLGRFALLIQNRGRWHEDTIVSADALDELLCPSQTMNPAYGLLWWLNGREAYVLPGSSARTAGPLLPSAPKDLVFGYGGLDSQLAVSWSHDLSTVRLGAPMIDPHRTYIAFWSHLSGAYPNE